MAEISLIALLAWSLSLDRPGVMWRLILASAFGPLTLASIFVTVQIVLRWRPYLEIRGDKLRMGGYFGCTEKLTRIDELIIKPHTHDATLTAFEVRFRHGLNRAPWR